MVSYRSFHARSKAYPRIMHVREPKTRRATTSSRRSHYLLQRRRWQETEDAPLEESARGEAVEEGEAAEEPPAKKIKRAEANDDPVEKAAASVEARENASIKVPKLLKTYGAFPLEDAGLSEPFKSSAETMFAHFLNALLTTTLSRLIAEGMVRTIIEAGHADHATLEIERKC